ncbi:type II toxin-antitoxin system RelE/ParE family toxin [Inquilinus sp. CAU 1745]|uniref:type II toxin-antitoxin system RelE/ParE family toxin n=1 Tax=Inquilinus sp. CAU 1745 TaxID=3140369 RepID=UPI00325B7806
MAFLGLVYAIEAVEDLQSIYLHIASDSPESADRFVREIEARCEILREVPEIGVSRSDLLEGARILTFRRRVVIVYRLSAGKIDVLRIFYGGRDYEAIILGE